jgi:glycosyltransferase involved in cell wall biosynthesis
MPKSQRPFSVVWHYEPLPPPRAAKLPWPRLHLQEIRRILLRSPGATDVYSNYLRLRSLARHGLPDLLVVSTLSRREFLAERGITAHWAPLGYHPSQGRDLGLPRDIDVLFLGDVKIPRRKPLLTQLQQHRVNLMAVGDWSDPAYWGENRTRLLNRTKIFLNVQRYSGELSGQRLLIGMANKALVISEPMYNPAPYVSGKHYITATIEEMPEVIRYYLAHEDERRAVVEDAYRLVTQEVTLEHSLSRILALLKAQRGQLHDERTPEPREVT